MRLSNKDRRNLGFTILETMTVLVMISISLAISIPSFVSMNNKIKLKNGLSDLRNSLQEVQRKAIRTSTSCTVTLPASGTTNPTISSPCLLKGDLTLNNINIRNNLTSIIFNYRGDTSTSTSVKGTIVLSIANQTDSQKCLVISPGIGLMKTGDYNDNDRTGTDPNNCTFAQ